MRCPFVLFPHKKREVYMEIAQTDKIEFDKNVVYQVGKTTAVINCNFRQDDKETVCTILSRLIEADIENR